MSATLPPVLRRALALALLGTCVLVAEMLLMAPLRTWQHETEARLAAARTLLARTRAVLAAESDTAPPEATEAEALLLPAGDDVLAAASLQSLLRAAAAAEGIALASIQVEPASAVGGARRIALRATLNAGFAPLLRLAHRLESGAPLARIEALEVQATDTGADPQLNATLSVVALMRAPAP